jgi:hypothetical protein
MNMDDIKAVFESHDGEYLKFDRVENKLSKRPDLHAFLLLDQILPGDSDIVSAAEHDEIFLDIELDDLADAGITNYQVRDLVRCGVRVSDFDCLCMFA